MKTIAALECPGCGEQLTVPITVTLTRTGDVDWLTCEPDLADVWAHAWACEQIRREDG